MRRETPRTLLSRWLLTCWLTTCRIIPAPAAEAPPPPEPPIAYVAPCRAAPGTPSRIAIRDTAKGPIVTVVLDGATATSSDANLAHRSRRFFFTIRGADDGLVEFQGHARADALDGTLGDAHGARHITMPVEGAAPACGRRQPRETP